MGRTERLAQPEDFAKYQLIARLAHGRIGDVYKAKSHGVEGFEKILVVKIIDQALVGVPNFVDTLIEEAKRAVSLSHANVVQVYDLGREDDDGRVYVATEFVNGFDLDRARSIAARSGRHWSHENSIFIASEIAKGLDYAHRRKDFNFNNLNILHRAVTPHNVLISNDGEVKITDFGISRALDLVPPLDDEDLRRRYLYAAPEYARGDEYTRQSDIFAVGLVLYEMLTGHHPYAADDGEEVKAAAQRAQIPPVGEFTEVPRQLQQILESMLVPDPAGRARSAGAIYEELIGYLFGNNLRADNRSLGLLMQELRRDEQRVAPEEITQEVGLEEISLTDLHGALGSEAILDEDSDLGEASEPTKSDLPRAKIQRLVMGRSSAGDHPPLPGGLQDHFLSARAGNGKAVLVTGQFGAGRHYLADRLVDALGWRGNTQAFGIQTTEEDVYRPFGVLSDLILRCLHETITGSTDHRKAALQFLGQLGADDQAQKTLAALWGINPTPRIGYDERRRHLTSVFTALLEDFCRNGPLVLVIDRVERLDGLSLDVLRDVVANIGQMSVMLIMTTTADELMRSAFDMGQPEDLEAVRVVGEEPPELSEIDGIDDDAADILMMLGISGQPMSQAELSQLLSMPGDRLMNAVRDLGDQGLVRVPRTGVFLAGVAELLVWVEQRYDRPTIERAASALARYYTHRVVIGEIDRLTPTLLRLYALAGDRRSMLGLADRYSRWLEKEGWLEIALDFYKHAADLLALSSLGAPQARIAYILSRAELALELARLDEARSSLEPVAALTETVHYDRGLIRGQILLGQMAMQQDDLDDAATYFRRASDTARSLNDPDLLARSLLSLAGWHERYGDTVGGQRMLEGAMNLYNRWGTYRMDLSSRALMLQRAIQMWAERGMTVRAEGLAADLERLAASTNLAAVDCRAQSARARLLTAGEAYDDALDLLDQAVREAHRHGLTALRIELMRQQATVALQAEQWETAREVGDALARLASYHQDIFSQHLGYDVVAAANCAMGEDAEVSLDRLEASLTRATERSVPRDIHRAHTHLERALRAMGRTADADQHARQAHELARRMRFTAAA